MTSQYNPLEEARGRNYVCMMALGTARHRQEEANAEVARCEEAYRQSQEALIAELEKPKKRSHRRKEETK